MGYTLGMKIEDAMVGHFGTTGLEIDGRLGFIFTSDTDIDSITLTGHQSDCRHWIVCPYRQGTHVWPQEDGCVITLALL